VLRGDDDDVIMDAEDATMIDRYWSKASFPASIFDWNIEPSQYFSCSSGSSSPSTLISEDDDVKWQQEYMT